MKEVSGKPSDFTTGRGDENNFIETPDGRAKGKRNIAGTPVNSNGGTTAMRGTSTSAANAGLAKVNVAEYTAPHSMTGGMANAPLKPGHAGMGTVGKKAKR
jgi:hypothetical protein